MRGTAGEARVVVAADDLIWATRLVEGLRAAGATPLWCRTLGQLDSALAAGAPGDRADAVVVDLAARAYGGLEAVRRSAAAGLPVLAIGHHDDHELRGRAREAGAERVLAYRAIADDGAAVLSLWLASAAVPDILRHADAAIEEP